MNHLPHHHIHIYFGASSELNLNSRILSHTEDEERTIEQSGSQPDTILRIDTRSVLKSLLAHYLDTEVDQVQFDFGLNGKPTTQGRSDIQFSVAHSGEVFVFAFVRNSAVGVDIEKLDRVINREKILKFLFSDNELATFQKSDESTHQEQLINCWTRKEAFVKAQGMGLSFPLKHLEVSILPNEHAEVLSTKWDENEKLEWHLESFDVSDTHRGAVAVRGKIESLKIMNILEHEVFHNNSNQI